MNNWHSMQDSECLRLIDSRMNGLSREEVTQRLAQYGPNRLQPPQSRSPWLRFLGQFHNVLIYILLIAGVVTVGACLGDGGDVNAGCARRLRQIHAGELAAPDDADPDGFIIHFTLLE